MYFASGHYRRPLAFSEEALDDARRSVERIRDLVRRLDRTAASRPELDELAERFFDELADNFNTPAARAVLFEWVTEANRRLDAGARIGAGRLGEMLHAIGLENLLEGDQREADPAAERLLSERERARADRDFSRADRIRDQLRAIGYEVRDGPEGSRLVRRG
jgi:cysteinyl-tRNA synthetase